LRIRRKGTTRTSSGMEMVSGAVERRRKLVVE